MPLRQLVLAFPETLSDMLLAADDRYREAEKLLIESEFDAAIYLFGYAAEMWLKTACMLLHGYSPSSQVMAALPAIKKFMQGAAPSVPFAGYHDLAFLAESILQSRLTHGRPVAPSTEADLRRQIVNGLHNEWIVDMRYRKSALTSSDAWSALSQTWWVKTNWASLL